MTEGTNTDGQTLNIGLNLEQGGAADPTGNSGGDDGGTAGNEGTIEFKIPEEYATNQTLSQAKSVEDLCKTIVNQETLIGKKVIGIPDENSSPEEVAKFKEAFGVPVKFEDYNLESSPEIKAIYGEGDSQVLDEFKKVFHEAGINGKQAETLKKGYETILGGLIQTQQEKQKEMEAEFQNMISTSFGDQKEEKLKVAEEFLKANVSENLKVHLPHVLQDTKALMLVADLANNIYPDLKPEDITKTPGGSGELTAGKTVPELQADMQKIIGSPEFRDARNPGHQVAKDQWLAIAKQIDALKASGQK